MTSRFVIFLSVILTIWTAEHLYVGWRLWNLPLFVQPVSRRILVAGLVFGWISYIIARIAAHHHWLGPATVLEYIGGLWMGALFLLFAAFLTVDILTLGGKLAADARPMLHSAAAILALIGIIAAWIGGLARPRVIEAQLEAPGVAPTSILQISDLHLSPVSGDRRIQQVIEIIEKLDPDIITLTGDLIDGDTTILEEKLHLLQSIRARDGVFAVLGNHEFYASPAGSRKLFKKAGYRVLDNEAVELKPGLHIAGVPDPRGAAQIGGAKADVKKAIAAIPPEEYVVLLQHSPENEAEIAEVGVDLMLSGHTHGGQIWPFHLLVRAAYSHISGIRQLGGMTQITSRGAGWWGPRMRLFAPADVVLITLN